MSSTLSLTIRIATLTAAIIATRAAGAAEATRDAAAGVYPSVILYHKPHHDDGPAQVRRVAELGFQKLQIVVTLHCEIDEQRNVMRYGIRRGDRLAPLDDAVLAEFRAALQRTFAAAAVEGMEVVVLAHLDSLGPINDWRNHLRFDPLRDYEGYSYETAVIGSIADAAAAELSVDASVDVLLCGEMGCSVFEYPQSYRRVMSAVRARQSGPQWRLGVSLNFDGPAAGHVPTPRQRADVSALLADSDLLGMSEYRAFEPPPVPAEFAAAVRQFYAALDDLGVTGHRDLPLQFSEVGLGGGAGHNHPAQSPAVAAKMPWEGVDDLHRNPWAEESMRDFRRDFHAALLAFLAAPPTDVPVTDAFLWSEYSWDPLGVIDQGFDDDVITDAIRDHNKTVAARGQD